MPALRKALVRVAPWDSGTFGSVHLELPAIIGQGLQIRVILPVASHIASDERLSVGLSHREDEPVPTDESSIYDNPP